MNEEWKEKKSMRELNEILEGVRGRIAAACARAKRDPADVEIVAVTKTHGAEVVKEAWDAGLSIVGENKVQEAAWKKPASVSGPSWHLIGHLLTRLNAVADEVGASPHVLLEVNVSGEKSKTGMPLGEVDGAVRTILEACPRVTFEGFMTMAPFSENPEDARPYFRRLRELRDATEKRFGLVLPRLSMGMSGDYEVAVEEGATWLRLGTVLFGERPKVKSVRASADDADAGAGSGLDSYSGAGPTVKVLD